MISMETIYSDLNALTDAELEKLQLAVNGEVALRIQNERLARRIEKAVLDAQAVGFNDTEIATILEETTDKARRGPTDDAVDQRPTPPEPAKRGPSATNPRVK